MSKIKAIVYLDNLYGYPSKHDINLCKDEFYRAHCQHSVLWDDDLGLGVGGHILVEHRLLRLSSYTLVRQSLLLLLCCGNAMQQNWSFLSRMQPRWRFWRPWAAQTSGSHSRPRRVGPNESRAPRLVLISLQGLSEICPILASDNSWGSTPDLVKI